MPRTKPTRPVLGGTSFTNAGMLEPGSWTDSPTTGETIFYRVRLETGQRLRVTAKMPASAKSWQLDAADAVTPSLMLYAPSRVQLARKDGVLQGSSTASLTLASPQVRVQNREIEQSRNRNGSAGINAAWSASVAGDYYVALQLEPLQAYLSGRAMPVLMNVAVDGEASGAPRYAEEPATGSSSESLAPTFSSSAAPQSGTSPDSPSILRDVRRYGLVVIVGAALLVGAVFAARAWIGRGARAGHG